MGYTCIGNLAFGDATENVQYISPCFFILSPSDLWTEIYTFKITIYKKKQK